MWMKSDFLHSFWPFPFWQADNKTTQTWLTPYGRRSAPTGPEFHLRLMPHTAFNTHTHTHTNPYTSMHLHTSKTGKQRGSGWMYSDICSVPEADGEQIRPPGASATLHLPKTVPQPAPWHTWQLAFWTCGNSVAFKKNIWKPSYKRMYLFFKIECAKIQPGA